MKKVIRKQPDRKVKRKRKKIEEPTDVKIPIETWMRSQDISGFPNLTIQIVGQLDLDSLINCRQVSVTFKNFLDTNFGLNFWIESLCQVRKEYYLARVRLGLVYLAKRLAILRDYLVDVKSLRNYPMMTSTTWTRFLEIIENEGSIDDIIEFTKLIKQSEMDGSFSPIVLKWKNENNDSRPTIFCIL